MSAIIITDHLLRWRQRARDHERLSRSRALLYQSFIELRVYQNLSRSFYQQGLLIREQRIMKSFLKLAVCGFLSSSAQTNQQKTEAFSYLSQMVSNHQLEFGGEWQGRFSLLKSRKKILIFL